jgi:phosphopantothenoylcysteine decarboxylase/phosphopantothenate--cysteine ligase
MKIILAVTGSISAYKALDICRGLSKSGHEVRVIVSKGACEFLNPKAFHYLGAKNVYSFNDDFNLEQYESDTKVLHIDLVKWCDRVLISPASANTIAKLAGGFCDDLISSVFLALGDKPCLIFPAMNTNMLTHPMTQENLKKLSELKNVFIHPTKSGELACGDVGAGKLSDVELIIEVTPIINISKPTKTILITTGATMSALDPVRYITNASTGITGYKFAKEYLRLGYKVILIKGFNSTHEIDYLKDLPNIKIMEAATTAKMHELVLEHFDDCDYYISTAAMSDIEFDLSDSKLKKDKFNGQIPFHNAVDVLASVLDKKVKQKIVGFAAESSSDSDTFINKWKRKPVDLLIGNVVSSGATSAKKGFGSNENEYFFIKDAKIVETLSLSKDELAKKILDSL